MHNIVQKDEAIENSPITIQRNFANMGTVTARKEPLSGNTTKKFMSHEVLVLEIRH